MWSRGLVSILLSILAIAESEKSRKRVTFPFSEVIPSENDRRGFDCAEGCAVYTTKNMTVYQNQKAVANINVSAIEKDTAISGAILHTGSYTISSTSASSSSMYYYSNNNNFITYVVSAAAPNFGTPVFVLQEDHEMTVKTNKRFFTILANSNAMELSNFTGAFAKGYPKVYATGFDSVSDLYGVTSCRPVYAARSQRNAEQSSPVIFAPIVTVDFGCNGVYSVSVKDLRYGYSDRKKSAGASTVYMSPGYIGCPFAGTQSYEIDNNSGERTVRDGFTIIASSLDISIAYYNAKATFRVNQDILDFISIGPAFSDKHYGPGAFKVELDWRSYTIATNSWAMQLDFGANESYVSAASPNIQLVSDQPMNASAPNSPTLPTRAQSTTRAIRWQWETYGPASQKYPVEASRTDYKNDTESWDVMGWADKIRSRFESHVSYQNNTQTEEALDWMEGHIRLLHICLFIFLVAALLFCVYRRKRAARAYDGLQLTENK